MPVYSCGDGKYKIGKDGECKYHSKKAAENAFKHWIDTKESEEMTDKIDEKFELKSEKYKEKEEDGTSADDIGRLMKMAGINQKMEDDKDEGNVNFDGIFTGVAKGEIDVKEDVDEDVLRVQQLAGLSEGKPKRSIFSRDQEHDRFTLFKEFDNYKKTDEGEVIQGPWGQGGLSDPQVRDPLKPENEPDSAEILDKYFELVDPRDHPEDHLDASVKIIDWIKNEYNVPEERAFELVDKALEDTGLNLVQLLSNRATNEADEEYDDEEEMPVTYFHSEPQKYEPRDLVEIANSRLGGMIAEQLASIMGYDFKWSTWGGEKNPEPMEEQNMNALGKIAEFLHNKGEEEMAQEIERYLSQISKMGEGLEEDGLPRDYDAWKTSPPEEYGTDVEQAIENVVADFNVQDFLKSHGSDFDIEEFRSGAEHLDPDDKTYPASYIIKSLEHYLNSQIDADVDMIEDAKDLFNEKVAPVLKEMGYIIKMDEAAPSMVHNKGYSPDQIKQMYKQAMENGETEKANMFKTMYNMRTGQELEEKSPKGWEKTVKAMKDEPGIENPYALANWMKKKGYKSRKESYNPQEVVEGWLSEVAPPGEKAERFIKKAKDEFKRRYGDRWEEVLYATAWDKFGESVNEDDEEEWRARWETPQPESYYQGGKGFQEIWHKIKDAENALGPLGNQRLDLILDNFPISIDSARRILSKIEELEKEQKSQDRRYYQGLGKGEFTRTGESEDPILHQLQIEEAMKNSKFKEGSLSRLMIEMIVDEMKKGKTPKQISEDLSFNPEEVFHIVEFFKNKKVKENKKEEPKNETVKESVQKDSTLERIRYLTEYKNTR